MARNLEPELHDFVHRVLPKVSRTFTLGIEKLQQPLRDQVAVAYLVCRVIDTLEDTAGLDAQLRIKLLREFAKHLSQSDHLGASTQDVAQAFVSEELEGDDVELCREVDKVFSAFDSFDHDVRTAVKPAVVEMAEGMAQTLERDSEGVQLQSFEDLDRYCYYVAGTVGKLLTELFVLDRKTIEDRSALDEYGVRFGLGLQVTNIMKDVSDDFGRGVVYLPKRILDATGLSVDALLSGEHPEVARAIVGQVVQHALGHLDAALSYTKALPVSEADVRLFCALPMLFALRTARVALEVGGTFDESRSVKITRTDVEELYQLSSRAVENDDELTQLFMGERDAVQSLLDRLNAKNFDRSE